MVDEIDVLRALAHPVRWGILERLAAEPGICACTFTEYFNVSQPTISAHLKALRQAGLVTTERRGTEIWYSLARDQLAPLAGRLSGIASSGAPVAPEAQATVPQATVPQATVPYAAARQARAPVPEADARSPGRLADVVAPAMAAAARMSGGLADPPPLAKRASGGLAAAAAAAQAAAQAARRPSGDDGVADRPPVPQRSRGLADMAALAQAAVPRVAGRRGRIPRMRGARASVAAGSAED
jgi:ArsR family transcriptional regulator, arsenate/arsenite/antimonite-responsive transcriptional repressor